MGSLSIESRPKVKAESKFWEQSGFDLSKREIVQSSSKFVDDYNIHIDGTFQKQKNVLIYSYQHFWRLRPIMIFEIRVCQKYVKKAFNDRYILCVNTRNLQV